MRITNIVFIVFFMLMLIVPLVFVDLSNDRVSVEENRMLAVRPPLAYLKYPRTFIRQFDEWFKDSTGFRERFIAIYNVIDKNKWINNTVRYTDGQYTYLIGEQGHHYFAGQNGYLIPKFQGEQFLSDKQLQNMAIKLEEAKRYLDSKGIPMVVMLCADKETIYPEFYPKSIKRGSEPVQLEMITTYLQEHTSVDVFNIRQALRAEKDNYLLNDRSYDGNLTHYNEVGAFFAYRELMKHINIHFPTIVPFEMGDVEIIYDEKEIATVSLKTKPTYEQLDPSFFDDVDLVRPFTAENYACENTESGLPVIIFLKDSYANESFIGKYFAQHFGKAIFIHFKNLKNFEEYINLYNPDIVVFESAERSLRGFANAVATIPELP